MVLFGGLDYYAACPENYTYTYSTGVYHRKRGVERELGQLDRNGHGTRRRPGGPRCRLNDMGRPARWDLHDRRVQLHGGLRVQRHPGSSSAGSGPRWPAPAAFSPGYGYTLAVNSTHIGVFVVGGFRYGAPAPDYGSQDEWVFETPRKQTLTETPTPVDLGTEVNFTAGWTLDTGTGCAAGWNVSYGDGPYRYSAPRPAFGSGDGIHEGLSVQPTRRPVCSRPPSPGRTSSTSMRPARRVSPTVDPALGATITASAMTITAGGTVTFTTSPSRRQWDVHLCVELRGRDGRHRAGPGGARLPRKAGTYVVDLTVIDSLDHSVKAASVTITVNTAPSPLLVVQPREHGHLPRDRPRAAGGLVVAIVLLMPPEEPRAGGPTWRSGACGHRRGAPARSCWRLATSSAVVDGVRQGETLSRLSFSKRRSISEVLGQQGGRASRESGDPVRSSAPSPHQRRRSR